MKLWDVYRTPQIVRGNSITADAANAALAISGLIVQKKGSRESGRGVELNKSYSVPILRRIED